MVDEAVAVARGEEIVLGVGEEMRVVRSGERRKAEVAPRVK